MSPVLLSPVLVLTGKVQALFEVARAKKGLLDLGTSNQVLLLESITNCLGADIDVGDISELPLEMGSCVSLACGDKSHQLMVIIGRELSRVTTNTLGKSASNLRAKFRDSRVTNSKPSSNLATRITILQQRDDRHPGLSRKLLHDRIVGEK